MHQSSYVSVERATEVMAMAPQDELAAETLALQSELAAVMASNRGRIMAPLTALVKDVATQSKKREEADLDEAFAAGFFAKTAAKTSMPGMRTMPNSAHNTKQMISDVRMAQTHPGHSPRQMVMMNPVHAQSEEAFCAVCSDGFSAPPNVILFCDRCDVPVHQRCYNVKEIPQHEWLCWPCREYEDELVRQGKTREEIRPQSLSLEHRSQLPGGSKEADCALCPIKGGAFRKTIDGSRWVHQVRAPRLCVHLSVYMCVCVSLVFGQSSVGVDFVFDKGWER